MKLTKEQGEFIAEFLAEHPGLLSIRYKNMLLNVHVEKMILDKSNEGREMNE
jgi:hypothetical protein